MARMMRDGEDVNYEVIKHKSDDPASKRVTVVKGRSLAERTVDRLDRSLTEDEKKAGWSHFLQRTTSPAPETPAKKRRFNPGGARKGGRR